MYVYTVGITPEVVDFRLLATWGTVGFYRQPRVVIPYGVSIVGWTWICDIENEGLGEFLQGYGTPLFVSSEYSLNYSAVTVICISTESYNNFRSWNVISGRFLFCPDWWELWWKFELTHKQKNSKPSLRQRSGEIDNSNRAAQCAFTLIFLFGREALYSDIKGFATHASFRRICWRNCIGP